MNHQAKIIISGAQTENSEEVEVTSLGQIYERDGFTCLLYDEVVDEDENGLVQAVKNLIKINDEQIEVIKEGPAETHMVFVPNETTFTYYSTPVGEMEVSIHTKSVERQNKPDGFSLDICYDLEMNQTFISSCNVKIAVQR